MNPTQSKEPTKTSIPADPLTRSPNLVSEIVHRMIEIKSVLTMLQQTVGPEHWIRVILTTRYQNKQEDWR